MARIVVRKKPVASVAPKAFTQPKRSVAPGFSPSPQNVPGQGAAQDPFVAPPDPALIAQTAANNQPYLNAYASGGADVARLGSDYGYSTTYTPGAIDPTTGLPSLPDVQIGGVDLSNPNSRASLLQKSYDTSKRGNQTGMASHGQLYSGALQNAQNAAQSNFNTASEQNRLGFQDAIRGWYGGLGSARTGALQGNASAQGSAADRAALAPAPSTVTYAGVPYNPPAPGEFASPVGAPTAASVMASKSLKGTAWDRPIISAPYRPKRPKKK